MDKAPAEIAVACVQHLLYTSALKQASITISVNPVGLRLLILTTMFAFVVSCTLILVKSERIAGSYGKGKYVASHLKISKKLSAYGTIYLIGMLVFVFFIWSYIY